MLGMRVISQSSIGAEINTRNLIKLIIFWIRYKQKYLTARAFEFSKMLLAININYISINYC